jgi:peptidoglycan/xylan/chitin deacetylase (PgdA/CDA1 family)
LQQQRFLLYSAEFFFRTAGLCGRTGCFFALTVMTPEKIQNAVPVLLYHHINPHGGDTVTVTPEVFAGQMRLLAESGYRTLTLGELLEFVKGKEAAAAKAVVITFDDGWLDNYLFAYPVLLQYRFTAATFLVTGRVAAARVASLPEQVPCHEEAKRLISAGEAGRVVMDWDLVRRLQDEGLMEFYSHTVSHHRCSGLGAAELAAELQMSKAALEAETGRSCPYLCWPYGDWDEAALQAALAAGYTAVFTTVDGFTRRGSDPAGIRRIEVKNSVEWLRQRLSQGGS